MNKIVFDLDGVIRDLMRYCYDMFNIPEANEWFWKYKNKDIYDWVKEDNYNALLYSKPTKYFSVIKNYSEKLEIWSHQPLKWRSLTKRWLDYHLGDYTIRYLNTSEKRKRLDAHKNLWLVEDSPNFSNYDRIILIDKLYNKNINCKTRIKTCLGLAWVLKNKGS